MPLCSLPAPQRDAFAMQLKYVYLSLIKGTNVGRVDLETRVQLQSFADFCKMATVKDLFDFIRTSHFQTRAVPANNIANEDPDLNQTTSPAITPQFAAVLSQSQEPEYISTNPEATVIPANGRNI